MATRFGVSNKILQGENYVYALRLAIGRVCGKFPVSL